MACLVVPDPESERTRQDADLVAYRSGLLTTALIPVFPPHTPTSELINYSLYSAPLVSEPSQGSRVLYLLRLSHLQIDRCSLSPPML